VLLTMSINFSDAVEGGRRCLRRHCREVSRSLNLLSACRAMCKPLLCFGEGEFANDRRDLRGV
jgi:hypothetical protein